MAKLTQSKSFLFGAVAGGVLGSVTALLLAPKSGRELRKDITEGAHHVGERTVHIAGQVGETTTRIAKQVGGGAANLAGKARDTAGSMIGGVRSWRIGKSDDQEAEETQLADVETAEQVDNH
jgi:gas vesicle protein